VPQSCLECGGLVTEVGKARVKCISCGAQREQLVEEAGLEPELEDTR
jgi:hypothetical protein